MNIMADRRLCIFARCPRLGQVKTRLARTIGEEDALRAHIELVTSTLERLAGLECEVELWIGDGGSDNPQVREWCAHYRPRLRLQRGPDLGARMHYALAAALDDGVIPVLTGCDCPGIDAAYVESAFEMLECHEVVIGPAEDGGYGLIGVRRKLPELFRDVPWSTSRVLAVTRERLAALGIRPRLLDELYDVDDEDGWRRYQASIQLPAQSDTSALYQSED